LAAWLPHRNLVSRWISVEDLKTPPDSDWDTLRMRVIEYRRAGMCRREWERQTISRPPSGSGSLIRLPVLMGLMLRASPSPVDTSISSVPSLDWGTQAPLDSQASCGVHDARGWPLLSFWCELGVDRSRSEVGPFPPRAMGGLLLDERMLVSPDVSDIRVLPYRPLWKGVLVNSLTYGVCWFFGVGGTRAIRQSLRRRRGACFNCGYELAGLPDQARCPECGVPPRVRAIKAGCELYLEAWRAFGFGLRKHVLRTLSKSAPKRVCPELQTRHPFADPKLPTPPHHAPVRAAAGGGTHIVVTCVTMDSHADRPACHVVAGAGRCDKRGSGVGVGGVAAA